VTAAGAPTLPSGASDPGAGGSPGQHPGTAEGPWATIPPRAPGSDACPLCGAALAPDQEWCLNCGAAARTRLAATPDWKIPVAVIAVVVALSLGVLAAALVKLTGDSGSAATPVATTITTAAGAPAATATPTAPASTVPAVPTTAPSATTPTIPAAPTTSVPAATAPSTATSPAATAPSKGVTSKAIPGLTKAEEEQIRKIGAPTVSK
jgi:predicted nucleic acid-binding Zn ribbon protein